MDNLTIIYYTANRVQPELGERVREQLLEAAGSSPIISVSQAPLDFGDWNFCIGDIGQNCWNIYHQMLIGAQYAKTKYVATAEDDCLYSYAHFHHFLTESIPDDTFMYNMNRWVMFTWIRPPVFGFRNLRLLADQLICNRELLCEALEERMKKYPSYESLGWKERLFGEPGRNEKWLKVTERKTDVFWSSVPNVRFNHEASIGYKAQGKRKAFAPVQAEWLLGWGSAEEALRGTQ